MYMSLALLKDIIQILVGTCKKKIDQYSRGGRGRDRMVVGFSATCTSTISAYHH
jgi:hypothetical protein